jgi:hypothetical protein
MNYLYYRDLENEEPMKLKDSQFKIQAQFIDQEYDNNDNEYAKIKM